MELLAPLFGSRPKPRLAPHLAERRARQDEEEAAERFHLEAAAADDALRRGDEQRRYCQSLSQAAHAAAILQSMHADELERHLQAESVAHRRLASELEAAQAELQQTVQALRISLDAERTVGARAADEARRLRAWADEAMPAFRRHTLNEEQAYEAHAGRSTALFHEASAQRAALGREVREVQALKLAADRLEEEVRCVHAETRERRIAERGALLRLQDEAVEHQHMAARRRVLLEHEQAKRTEAVEAAETRRLADAARLCSPLRARLSP